jgi:hypothetical protein
MKGYFYEFFWKFGSKEKLRVREEKGEKRKDRSYYF